MPRVLHPLRHSPLYSGRMDDVFAQLRSILTPRAIRTRGGFFNFTSIDSKLFTELAVPS